MIGAVPTGALFGVDIQCVAVTCISNISSATHLPLAITGRRFIERSGRHYPLLVTLTDRSGTALHGDSILCVHTLGLRFAHQSIQLLLRARAEDR